MRHSADSSFADELSQRQHVTTCAFLCFFFFQAEDGIRDTSVTGVQTCALPICFFSNIMREPLAGEEAVLPVSEDVRHWHASPKSAVGFLVHAGTMDLDAMGADRKSVV